MTHSILKIYIYFYDVCRKEKVVQVVITGGSGAIKSFFYIQGEMWWIVKVNGFSVCSYKARVVVVSWIIMLI